MYNIVGFNGIVKIDDKVVFTTQGGASFSVVSVYIYISGMVKASYLK